MTKLNALFVVAISSVEFQFTDIEAANAFQRRVARYSSRQYRKLAGKTGELGPSPCVGSLCNAYPILEDGAVSEAGLTLGVQPSEIKYTAKKEKSEKDGPSGGEKTPRRGRKAEPIGDDSPDPDED